jgi:tetratricopeptide (TPR) repeat protein
MKIRPHQLPHHVFLTRTETSPATSLEARFGHADFLVLRLVDLLDSSRRDPVSPDAFQYQVAASARFVRELEHEGFEVPYLLSLIDELPLAFETKEPWRLWTSLCCLSINLQDRERWEEASDVLETTWHLVDDDWPEGQSLDVALRLGEHYVRIDRSADAARLYRAAARRAGAGGRRTLRVAQTALLLPGEAQRAEGRYRRLLREAAAARDRCAETDVELGLARALLAQGRATEAASHAWRAHQLAEHPVNAGDALLAVAAAFESMGAFRTAAQAYWSPSLGHPRPTVRWSALAGLVRVLSRIGDRMSFERWRRFGERIGGDMPSPSFEAEFVIEAARGLARFGYPETARRFLSTAAARLEDLGSSTMAPRFLKAEEELDDLAGGRDIVEAKELPVALKAVADDVARLGDPPSPPDTP